MNKRKLSADEKPPMKRTQICKSDESTLFHESVPSLRQMSCVKVALAVWYHHDVHNIRHHIINVNDLDSDVEWNEDCELDRFEIRRKLEPDFHVDSFDRNVLDALNHLTVTRDVREAIREWVVSIRKKIDEWVRYQHDRIFFHYVDLDVVYVNVDEIAWKCNGDIDYAQSARNMLKSLRINQVEKYRLMCTFCFTDEIEKMNAALLSNRFIERVLLEEHPMIYYWNALASDKLNCIARDLPTVYKLMIGIEKVDNERAIEYFWNLLKEEQKVECAKALIEMHGVKFQAFVLRRLDQTQRYELYDDLAVRIVLNFANSSSCRSVKVIPVWVQIADVVKEEQFASICALMINRLQAALLTKMWKVTPIRLKRFVLESEERKIVDKLLSRLKLTPCCEEEVRLMFEMIRDASDATKAEVIRSESGRRFCHALTQSYLFAAFEEIVTMCLPTPQDLYQFKLELTSTDVCKKFATSLLSEARTTALQQYLSVYISDAEVADYKKELLTSEDGVGMCASWLETDNYKLTVSVVTQILPDVNAQREFCTKVVLSVKIIRKFHSWIMSGCIYQVENCFKQLNLDRKNILAVKQRLMKLYQGVKLSNLYSRFTHERWRTFVTWCWENDESVLQYKLALPIHDIFAKMLEKATFNKYDALLSNCKFKQICDFNELDEFLIWYFGTAQEVKKFKLREVFDCTKIGMIVTLLKKRDCTVLRSILSWFFDNDRVEIEKFRVAYRYCKLANLV